MKTLSPLLLALLALSGCANLEYKQYLDANRQIDTAKFAAQTADSTAKHNADAARYRAISLIAESGSESAKIAAVMALALGNQAGNNVQQVVATPLATPPVNQALQWAGLLVPSITTVAGMRYNYMSTATQSNNARDVAVSTNSTFASMGTSIQNTAANSSMMFGNVASMIQSPAANVTTNNSIGGAGVVGAGTLATTDNHAATSTTITMPTTTTTTTTANPSTITPAGKVCAVDATGVLVCL